MNNNCGCLEPCLACMELGDNYEGNDEVFDTDGDFEEPGDEYGYDYGFGYDYGENV